MEWMTGQKEQTSSPATQAINQTERHHDTSAVWWPKAIKRIFSVFNYYSLSRQQYDEISHKSLVFEINVECNPC
jgi:hypothetical protein